MAQRKQPEDLRSHKSFGVKDLRSFGHRSRALQMGYTRQDFSGKPVIAIINTWSDINQCHAHFRQRAEEVKRGVLQAGGFPLEMPAIALAEVFQKPTTRSAVEGIRRAKFTRALSISAGDTTRFGPSRSRINARTVAHSRPTDLPAIRIGS